MSCARQEKQNESAQNDEQGWWAIAFATPLPIHKTVHQLAGWRLATQLVCRHATKRTNDTSKTERKLVENRNWLELHQLATYTANSASVSICLPGRPRQNEHTVVSKGADNRLRLATRLPWWVLRRRTSDGTWETAFHSEVERPARYHTQEERSCFMPFRSQEPQIGLCFTLYCFKYILKHLLPVYRRTCTYVGN